MNDWELKDGEQEFDIPPEPVNPMTPERLKKLKEDADRKMLELYAAMITGSAVTASQKWY